eukprot:4038138-Amphidinium_carterae.4
MPNGKYMEIKTKYKQNCKDVIVDRMEYKQRHFHDHSVTTSNIYVNEECAKITIIYTEIYAQSSKKPESPPRYQHRLLLFVVQHHSVTRIMVFDYFDEQHFNKPNVCNLTKIQPQQQLE